MDKSTALDAYVAMLVGANVQFVEVDLRDSNLKAIVVCDTMDIKVAVFSDWCVASLFGEHGELVQTGMYHLKDFGLTYDGVPLPS